MVPPVRNEIFLSLFLTGGGGLPGHVYLNKMVMKGICHLIVRTKIKYLL